MKQPPAHRIRRSVRRPRRGRLAVQLAALAGCAAALQPSAASARGGSSVPPAGSAVDAAPPWVGSDGFPPPRPLARTRAAAPLSHPAIHPEAVPSGRPRPLFPRASDVLEERAQRKAAMDRHPAGKGRVVSPPASAEAPASIARSRREPREASPAPRHHPASGKRHPCTSHRVEPGETLWGIASRWSKSERPVEILRLAMEIYRMNRDVIGPDPDLILPGQLLSLPESCER